ncbi:homoserine kinase [Clostridium tarantellae]|uniref:Homoserine kinase n=1 Tax=Clostridium tarantellae TaxID=39493 RepID=A0A6I1MVW8_9CLOT|nr:homoserine kinase [Clostridium tarantellae]MPQ44971.1 homoserine kinase [Clostridium tarantellae]
MVKIRVPATSANIGPAFDCLGVALNQYNVFEFSKILKGVEFEGFKDEFCNENNLVYKAMKKVYEKAGKNMGGIKIALLENNIPISSGLGSSSSCIVAGLFGANSILGNRYSKDELLNMAIEIEQHPDNVAPAILGGMVLALVEWGEVYYEKIKVSDSLKFITVIPDFPLSTNECRNILPKKVDFRDAIYNTTRSAMTVASFIKEDYEKLKYYCNDRLHEQYRYVLIPKHKEILDILNGNGCVCSFLSGAGPTIIGINNCCEDNNVNAIKEKIKEIKDYKYSVKVLKTSSGVKIY